MHSSASRASGFEPEGFGFEPRYVQVFAVSVATFYLFVVWHLPFGAIDHVFPGGPPSTTGNWGVEGCVTHDPLLCLVGVGEPNVSTTCLIYKQVRTIRLKDVVVKWPVSIEPAISGYILLLFSKMGALVLPKFSKKFGFASLGRPKLSRAKNGLKSVIC